MIEIRGVADGQASREYQSALVFLQSTPRDALEHIRSLRIVFSLFSYDNLCPGSRSLTNWIQPWHNARKSSSRSIGPHTMYP